MDEIWRISGETEAMMQTAREMVRVLKGERTDVTREAALDELYRIQGETRAMAETMENMVIAIKESG